MDIQHAKGTYCLNDGWWVRSGAGLNGPSERLRLPAVTERDRAALKTIRGIGADYVAQSFVRSADDVRELRDLMGRAPAPIMAKTADYYLRRKYGIPIDTIQTYNEHLRAGRPAPWYRVRFPAPPRQPVPPPPPPIEGLPDPVQGGL